MKKIAYLILAGTLVISCDNKTEEKPSSLVKEQVEIPSEETDESEGEEVEQETAISLWNSAGLYEKAGKSSKENKWKVSVPFGSQLTILEITEVDKKEYAKVSTKEGKEGWISTYLIKTNAHIAVITNNVRLYKSADILSMSDNKIEKGTIVVVDNEKIESYVGVTTKEKKAKGFLKSDKSLSVELVDLEVAQLRKRAFALEGDKKEEALQEIIDNPEYMKSAFYEEVSSALTELTESEVIIENHLMEAEDAMNVEGDNSIIEPDTEITE